VLYELISRIATIIVEELQFTKSNQSSFNLLRAIRVYNSWQANEGDKSGQEKVKGLTDELVTAIEQKLVKLKVNKDSDCNIFGRRRGDCVDALGNYTG
jgi:hypothetical protein